MENFKELNSLVDKYSKEISNILSNITDKDLKDIDYLYYKLNNYIHSKFPLENPKTLNGVTYNTQNTKNNFLAQCELSKRYNEFHTLCHEYFQRFEQDCSDENNP